MTHEHDSEAWDKHRARMGGRRKPKLTIAQWAHHFAQIEQGSIEAAIRSGIVAGLDNTEIARKVIGSLELSGMDGVTEFTRQNIARLGRVVLAPRRK